MNISDLNNKLYGYRNVKQGENIDFKMKSVEQQEMLNMNINNYNNDIFNKFDETNKEIKF